MKKVIMVLLVVVFCMSLFASDDRISTNILTGSGTELSPYLIEDYADLVILSTTSSYWSPGKYIKQTADIDATDSQNLNGGEGLNTIGNNSVFPFFANYDGDGYTISNLFMDRDNPQQGLFGFCLGGTITNVRLIDCNISGTTQVGSIVGSATNNSTIDNCSVVGNVNGTSPVGGLVGEAFSSSISNSSANVNVTSSGTSNNTGGLVGLLRNNSSIDNCSSQGIVTGYNDVGGLIGKMFSIATVSNSYSECDVNGNANLGGFIGASNEATSITNSFATGTVQGLGQNIAGFFGSINGSSTSAFIVHNCFSTGNASGEAYIGGFGGYTCDADINYCFSTGSPATTTTSTDKSGFVAFSTNTQCANSFWDVTTSGMTTSIIGIPKTSTELKSLLTFTDNGWDFVDETANGQEDIWSIDSGRNGGYPYLTFAEDYYNPVLVCPQVTDMYPENGSNNIQVDELFTWTAIPEVAGYTRGYEVTFNNEVPVDQTEVTFDLGVNFEYSTEYTWSVKPYYLYNETVKIYPTTEPEVYNFYTIAGLSNETTNEENPIDWAMVSIPEGATPVDPVVLTTLPADYAYQPLFALSYNFEVLGDYIIVIGASNNVGSIYHIFIDGRELEFGIEWFIDTNMFYAIYEYDGAKGEKDIVITNDDETLPVTLSSFNAVAQADQFVTLQWVTESESNLLGYNVYRAESENFSQAMRINPLVVPANNQSQTSTYSYTDSEIESTTYYYWLEVAELANENSFHGPIAVTVEDDVNNNVLPSATSLFAAYPNPFNPETTIKFNVKENDMASLIIYNVKGQIVKSYMNFLPGEHSLVWNGKDNSNNNVSSGLYLYKLISSSYTKTNKMILMK